MPNSHRWNYLVTFEGMGDPSASTDTDGLFKWSWSRKFLDNPGTQDPDGLFREDLQLLKWPQELETSFNPFRGMNVIGAITVSFMRTQSVLDHLWSGSPPVVAELQAAMTATTTTMVLDTGALSGTLYIGREAVYVQSVTGSGPYTYTVDRGVLATEAAPHETKEDGGDVEVFARMHPATLGGRAATLWRIPMDGTYTDAEVKFPGVLYRIYTQNGGGRIAVEIEHILSVAQRRKLYAKPWSTAGWGQIGFNPGKPDAGHSGDYRAIFGTNEGAWITPYTLGADGEIAFDGRGPIAPFAGSPRIPDEGLGRDSTAREIYSTHSSAPSNSASPSTNTLPLSKHPGELCLQLLLTTSGGANHSDWDLGLENLAGSIPASMVDVDAFLEWGDRQPDIDNFHIGLHGSDPVSLYETLQDRILKPLGASLIQGRNGLLTVASFADALGYGSTNTIAQSQIHSVEGLSSNRHPEEGIGRVVATFRDTPGRDPSTIDSNDIVNLERYFLGEAERIDMDAGGFSDPTDVQAIVIATVRRFHEPVIEYAMEVLNTADFYPGQVVAVTHAHLLANAAKGVTAAVCLIVARREELNDSKHIISMRMRYVGEIYESVGRIAPSAQIASWDGGTGVATFEANIYTHPSRGPINTDVAGFFKDDVVQLLDQYGAVRDSSITVVDVSSNTLQLSGVGVTPVAGDIIVGAPYGSASSTQKTEWAFVADSVNRLGSGDAAKQYVWGG